MWKLIGFFVGLFSKGPLGALLGLLAGWWLDNAIARASGRDAAGARGFGFGVFQNRAQQVFQDALFGCLGHLSKADGRVSRHEIRMAEQVMAQLGMNRQQRLRAIEQFQRGKASHYPLEEELAPFAAMTRHLPHLRRLFIEILLTGALADGSLGDAERRVLERAADGLGIGRTDLDDIIRQRYHQETAAGRPEQDPYEVLGISRHADTGEIKQAYRKLMSQYHPDKMSGREVPGTMREYAHRRVREVRAAYDALRKQHGFR